MLSCQQISCPFIYFDRRFGNTFASKNGIAGQLSFKLSVPNKCAAAVPPGWSVGAAGRERLSEPLGVKEDCLDREEPEINSNEHFN